MRSWICAVTFEAPASKPPETVQGVVRAASARGACGRAIAEASRARTGKTWDSLCILLEKSPPPCSR